MKKTKHDYQGCIVGNFFTNKYNYNFSSWEDFKNNFAGFTTKDFDDTYHYIFRYDIHEEKKGFYILELCCMLQRKGIYTHLLINNISQNLLDTEIKTWLQDRVKYIKSLWKEVDINVK